MRASLEEILLIEFYFLTNIDTKLIICLFEANMKYEYDVCLEIVQLVIGSFITTCLLMHHISCRVFGVTLNHTGDSAPLQPRFGILWLLAFPKTKVTFKREEIQTIDESQENMTEQKMVIGRTVWGPKGLTLKGTEVSFSYV